LASKKSVPVEPVEEVIEVSAECCQEDCGDCPLVQPSETENTVVEPAAEALLAHGWANTYVVKVEASYAVLGAALKPDGFTGHGYASYLYELNGGKPLKAGTVIKL
jgi:hypothetical protein